MAHVLLRCTGCGTDAQLVSSVELLTDHATHAWHLCAACTGVTILFLSTLRGTTAMPHYLPIMLDIEEDEAAHHHTCRCIECVDAEDQADELRFEMKREDRAS